MPDRRLGRGLGSLLSDRIDAPAPPELRRNEVPIDQIRPNPFQPRKHFDSAAMEELRTSIQNHGVLQPIVLRPSAPGYEILAGERRWRAARMAGLTSIPALVRDDISDEQMLELAIVENVQRQDLNPLERARGYLQLMQALRMTQDQVAERVGLQRSTVTNHLRLLDLPLSVQEAVAKGGLAMGHARALLGLERESDRIRMAQEIVERDLSVRDVERLVREAKEPAPPQPQRQAPAAAPEPWVQTMEVRMRDHLGTKVALRNASGYRGQIVIDYYNRDDLDRICALLAPVDSL